MPEIKQPRQYWLATLDGYGNVRELVDGPHSHISGPAKAAAIIESLGMTRGREFVVANIEVTPCVPNESGLNHQAIRDLHGVLRSYSHGWWRCKAEFGEHELTCRNYVAPHREEGK